jgi:leader peptidase (prepilin peptidase)/N-methyltransferase
MLDWVVAAPGVAAFVAGLFGRLIGSFLNVVILRTPPRLMHAWRVQAREVLELEPAPAAEAAPPGLVRERSHCPSCKHQLTALDNVPLLSFAVLRGRCRYCGVRISWQYPAVELLCALMTAACVLKFGPTLPALGAMVLTWMLIAAAGIDLHTQLLPDQLTLPLLWIGLLIAATLGWYLDPVTAILGAAAGYLVLWSVFWAFKLVTGKEGMGYGDFKLLGALGAFVGYQGIVPTLLFSSLIGAIVGSIWLAIQGRDKATPIPFGPYLAAAGWMQFMVGERLVAWWLHHSGF